MGIETALSALPSLATVAEKLLGAKSEADKQALLLDFQRAIIAAQGETMSLQNQLARARSDIERLQRELEQREDWAHERSKYEVRQVAEGVFCFMDKAASGNAKDLPKYCATCMERGRKSLLQLHAEFYQGVALLCHDQSCKARLEFSDFLPLA